MPKKRKDCEKSTACQCRDCRSLRRRSNTNNGIDNGSRVSWFWCVAETLDECVCDATRFTSFDMAAHDLRVMEEIREEEQEKRLKKIRKKYGPRSKQYREIKRHYATRPLKIYQVVHTFCINRDHASLPGGVHTNPKRWASGKGRAKR